MRSNEQLQRDVMAALKWEPQLRAAELGVAAHDGVITLSGVVDSYSKKLIAEQTAKKITGVKGLADEIDIRLLSSSQRSDTELAEAALSALRWYDTVPDNGIKVTVVKGWVKLEGNVEWAYQKEEAQNAVKKLTGVKGVTNLIVVKPHVKPKDVSNKIRAAFERSALIDARAVEVEVEGERVTLRGHVRSWAESEDAESAAWACPGITQVLNKLYVEEPEFAYE